MQTFIYTFRGFYPVGAYVYIRANDQEEANELFKEEIEFIGLTDKNVLANGDLNTEAVQITKVKPGKHSFVISNGDY